MFPTTDKEILRTVATSGARALLIGRQALVILGIPVATHDFDFWIHIDDAEIFNAAFEPLDFAPSRPPGEARRFGRYVLENSERIDVLVARAVGTIEGVRVPFDDLWQRRQAIALDDGSVIHIPAVDDLIATKRFAARPKDADDIRALEAFKSRRDDDERP